MAQTVRPRRSVLSCRAQTRALEGAHPAGRRADLRPRGMRSRQTPRRRRVPTWWRRRKSRSYGKREIAIRCNGLGTGAADIAAIAGSGADAHPGAQGRECRRGSQCRGAARCGRRAATMMVWAMMETPKGILRAEEIAGRIPASRFHHGHQRPLVKDMRARHTPMRLPMVTALGLGMLAQRAPTGSRFSTASGNDIKGRGGFPRCLPQGLEMGFDGKTLIHPSQVEQAVQRACSHRRRPSSRWRADRRRLQTAQAETRAWVTVDGHDREPACRAGLARWRSPPPIRELPRKQRSGRTVGLRWGPCNLGGGPWLRQDARSGHLRMGTNERNP